MATEWRLVHGLDSLGAFDVYRVRVDVWGPRRGDLDNYAKSVLDALAKVAFPDDSVSYVRDLHVIYQGYGASFMVSVSGVKHGE